MRASGPSPATSPTCRQALRCDRSLSTRKHAPFKLFAKRASSRGAAARPCVTFGAAVNAGLSLNSREVCTADVHCRLGRWQDEQSAAEPRTRFQSALQEQRPGQGFIRVLVKESSVGHAQAVPPAGVFAASSAVRQARVLFQRVNNTDHTRYCAPAGVCAASRAVRRARVSRCARRGCSRPASSSSHAASASSASACTRQKASKFLFRLRPYCCMRASGACLSHATSAAPAPAWYQSPPAQGIPASDRQDKHTGCNSGTAHKSCGCPRVIGHCSHMKEQGSAR